MPRNNLTFEFDRFVVWKNDFEFGVESSLKLYFSELFFIDLIFVE